MRRETLLRSLIVVHRLVWVHTRRATPRPTAHDPRDALCSCSASPSSRAGQRAYVRGHRWVGSGLADRRGAVRRVWLVVSARLARRDARWPACSLGPCSSPQGSDCNLTVYFLASRVPTLRRLGPARWGSPLRFFLGLFVIGRLVVLSARVADASALGTSPHRWKTRLPTADRPRKAPLPRLSTLSRRPTHRRHRQLRHRDQVCVGIVLGPAARCSASGRWEPRP